MPRRSRARPSQLASRIVNSAAGRGSMPSAPPLSAGVRLAELLAVLSLGADLGMNQPMEHVLRQSLIALRFGALLGFDEDSCSRLQLLSSVESAMAGPE